MTIKELRLSVAESCPYSCVYCNIYTKKVGKKNKLKKDAYIVGNESTIILLDKKQKKKLTLKDYSFLFKELKDNFGLEDITFTGGDPFMHPHIKQLIDLADSLGLRTTAITKGAPLFPMRRKQQAQDRLGNLSRIIISLDTMDKRKYAQTNLPLTPIDTAINYLPKTLSLIKRLVRFGYRVDVNSVLTPCPSKDNLKKHFRETKRLIDFCDKAGVTRVKFIELDSPETLGNPYIEDYFKDIKKEGFLSSKNTEVLAYRTHCPQNFIEGRRKNKLCEFKHGGELHLNQYGQSLLCQRDVKFNLVDIFDVVINQDSRGLSKKMREIDHKIVNQKCSFYV